MVLVCFGPKAADHNHGLGSKAMCAKFACQTRVGVTRPRKVVRPAISCFGLSPG